MVMAGTGEINCLRRLRYAYGMYNQPIRYGTHMATYMSLGLLFLGGGRFTLGTSDAAIACMVTAFFPRFPQVSSENKSYLQALRHLWVLAVEPRCLIARDVDTKEIVYLPVKIKVRDGKEVGTTQLISPTLIPDLDKLSSIRVDTPRYWPFYLDIANFPRHKQSLLHSQTLFVKRRTAFLSYMEDPKGSRSLFVRTGSSTSDAATLDFPKLRDTKVHPASDLYQFISSSSNDPLFLSFADHFCRDDGETDSESLFRAYCHATLLDSILQDKPQTLQSHLSLFRYRTMHHTSRYFNLRLNDLRYMADFYGKLYERRFSGRTENNPRPPLVRENTALGALHTLNHALDAFREDPEFLAVLKSYVRGEDVFLSCAKSPEVARKLTWYLQQNNVPPSNVLVLLRELASKAREQCLGAQEPEGTRDFATLEEGIKQVLHATAGGLVITLGYGWSVRSVNEIVTMWN
jgi:anaphase-promoting complex subunit 1